MIHVAGPGDAGQGAGRCANRLPAGCQRHAFAIANRGGAQRAIRNVQSGAGQQPACQHRLGQRQRHSMRSGDFQQ